MIIPIILEREESSILLIGIEKDVNLVILK